MRRASLLVVSVVVLAGCRGGVSDQPPVHLIRNMFTQEKGKPYRRDTSGLFADGRMMRTPIDGTVARGELDEDDLYYEGLALPLLPDGGTETTLADGGTATLEPTVMFPKQVKVDGQIPDSLPARGEARYAIYCVPCHGPDGDGKGVVAGRGLLVPPANFHDPARKELPAGRIYLAIKNGVNNDNMPSYAAQIPVADRWAIVAWVRKLQGVPYESGGNIKAVVVTTASAEAGAALYKSKICVTCHSLDGSKIVGPSFKGLYGSTQPTSAGDVKVDDAYLKESITQPMAKIVTGFPPVMPQQQYTEAELESLILFIKEQK